MTTVAAVHGVLPPHRYPQAQLTELFAKVCLPEQYHSLLGRLHDSAKVATRHLALPLEDYLGLTDFTAITGASGWTGLSWETKLAPVRACTGARCGATAWIAAAA